MKSKSLVEANYIPDCSKVSTTSVSRILCILSHFCCVDERDSAPRTTLIVVGVVAGVVLLGVVIAAIVVFAK